MKKIVLGISLVAGLGLFVALFFGIKRRLYIKDTYADFCN